MENVGSKKDEVSYSVGNKKIFHNLRVEFEEGKTLDEFKEICLSTGIRFFWVNGIRG